MFEESGARGTRRCFAVFAVAWISTCGSLLAQQPYSLNGDFGVNADGWIFAPADATGIITWDGSIGSPSPGSLRIEAVGTFFETHMALSGCLQTEQDDYWVVSSRVREETGSVTVECLAFFVFYNSSDCSGPAITPANFPAGPAPGSWQVYSYDVSTFPGIHSTRVALASSANGSGACNFDHVTLIGPSRGATAVPTLGSPGLGVFVLALAFAAVFLLGRQAALLK